MMEEFDFDLEKANDEADVVREVSEHADDKMRGLIGKVSRWRSMIVLALLGVITLIWPFAAFGLVNPFSVDFLVNSVYSLIIAMTCYKIFTPFGLKSERAESLSYKDVRENWLELSEKIRKEGFMRAFSEFCSHRREDERRERRAWLVDAAGFSFDVYLEKFAELSDEELRELQKKGELTKKQVENLILANGPIVVMPIHAYLILSGIGFSNINEVGREQKPKLMDKIRPVTLLATIIIRGVLDVAGGGGMGFMDYLAFIVTTLSIILTWSFTGFRYGVSIAREEERLMKGRSEFIQIFLEEAGESRT